MKREIKKERGGRGGEGRTPLQTKPSILKTCVRQWTQCLIGSASPRMLTCVNQRFFSHWEVMYGKWHKICPPLQEHFLWPLLNKSGPLLIYCHFLISCRVSFVLRSFYKGYSSFLCCGENCKTFCLAELWTCINMRRGSKILHLNACHILPFKSNFLEVLS